MLDMLDMLDEKDWHTGSWLTTVVTCLQSDVSADLLTSLNNPRLDFTSPLALGHLDACRKDS
jgi:hypothetical protein